MTSDTDTPITIWVCGKPEIWTRERWESETCEAAKFERNQSGKDFDEAWLSQWAASASVHKMHLIGQILESPYAESQDAHHCGDTLREVNGNFGTFYRCRHCDFKVNASTLWNWMEGKGRRNLSAEGLEKITVRYRLGLQMNNSGIFYTVREQYAKNIH